MTNPIESRDHTWWLAVSLWCLGMALFGGAVAWGSTSVPWVSIIIIAASVPVFIISLIRRRSWPRVIIGIAAIAMAIALDYLLVFWSAFPAYDGPLVANAAVPEFTLVDGAGNLRSSTELHGKRTLLVFFRGKW